MGFPQLFCTLCILSLSSTLLSVLLLHNFGPYGNLVDKHVGDFISVPLVSLFVGNYFVVRAFLRPLIVTPHPTRRAGLPCVPCLIIKFIVNLTEILVLWLLTHKE